MPVPVLNSKLVSFPPTVESLPRYEQLPPGLSQAQVAGPLASSAASASAPAMTDYERIINGWPALRSFEKFRLHFPAGQDKSPVCTTHRQDCQDIVKDS
eukprot:9766393-Prorocentrum_lima.AAC.1